MKNIAGTIVIALAVIISVAILARTYKKRDSNQHNIYVTGLGSKDFASDLIAWKGTFNRKNTTLKDAYTALGKDRDIIKTYLLGKGLGEKEIVFSSVDISKEFDESTDREGRSISTFSGYLLKQTVSIESKDVNKIEVISREITGLIDQGVEIYSNPPAYYYTRLSELKLDLLAAATRDGQSRAQKIAQNAGAQVGGLKSADMGIFQITGQNSSEDYSWGGAFNTSSYYKTATITVKLVYSVE